MNIFHITGAYSTKFGSVEKFFVAQMNANPEDHFILAYNAVSASQAYIDAVREAGGEIVVLSTERSDILRNTSTFVRICRKKKVDVVNFHFQFAFLLWCPIAWAMGIRKRVLTKHSCEYTKDFRQIMSPKQYSMLFRLLTLDGWVYCFFTDVLCVSEYVRKQFIRVKPHCSGRVNIQTVYLGTVPAAIPEKEVCETLKRELGIAAGERVVATTLFADIMKGVDVFIKAARRVKGKAKFMVIGMDEAIPFTQEMKRLAEKEGIAEKMIWVGITDHIFNYLAITDIYVQPSRTEALGLAVVEAMACRIPVVASNVGGLPELTPLLFDVEDAEGCAAQIDSLLSDEEKRQKMGEEEYKAFAEKFCVENGVRLYHEVYAR